MRKTCAANTENTVSSAIAQFDKRPLAYCRPLAACEGNLSELRRANAPYQRRHLRTVDTVQAHIPLRQHRLERRTLVQSIETRPGSGIPGIAIEILLIPAIEQEHILRTRVLNSLPNALIIRQARQPLRINSRLPRFRCLSASPIYSTHSNHRMHRQTCCHREACSKTRSPSGTISIARLTNRSSSPSKKRAFSCTRCSSAHPSSSQSQSRAIRDDPRERKPTRRSSMSAHRTRNREPNGNHASVAGHRAPSPNGSKETTNENVAYSPAAARGTDAMATSAAVLSDRYTKSPRKTRFTSGSPTALKKTRDRSIHRTSSARRDRAFARQYANPMTTNAASAYWEIPSFRPSVKTSLTPSSAPTVQVQRKLVKELRAELFKRSIHTPTAAAITKRHAPAIANALKRLSLKPADRVRNKHNDDIRDHRHAHDERDIRMKEYSAKQGKRKRSEQKRSPPPSPSSHPKRKERER